MKALLWMLAGPLVLAVFVLPCAAQAPPFPQPPVGQGVETASGLGIFLPRQVHPRQCPPSLGVPIPGEPPTRPPVPGDPPTPPTPSASPSDALAGAGDYKSTPGRPSPVLAGAGLGAAISGDPISTAILTPLVLPGMFNVAGSQSARPMDRVFFEYGHFQGVAVAGVGANAPTLIRTAIVPPPPPPPPPINSPNANATIVITENNFDTRVVQNPGTVRGFNLNTFNLGVEKTFLDGMVSGYLTVPFLNATENISGQHINGLGDVSIGFKVILYQNLDNGNTFTGGMTVSFPTAHPSLSSSVAQTIEGTGDALQKTTTTMVNPTFLQPWVAGLVVWDRFFIQEYFSVIVPTDNQVATFVNSDLTMGYTVYRSRGRLLSSLTPTFSCQAMIPLNHVGVPTGQGASTFVPADNGLLPAAPAPTAFAFPHQVFLMGGVQVGLGERCLFGVSGVVPVAGPRGYQWGVTAGLNYFY